MRHLIAIFITLFLTSSLAFARVEEKAPAFFIVSGGSASCGTDGWGRPQSPYGSDLTAKFFSMISVFKDRHPDVPIHYIVSCYKLSARSPIYFSGSLNSHQIYYGNTDDFLNVIKNYVHKLPNPNIYILGHSWGGWLSMKLVDALSNFRNIAMNLKLLATIDPISRVNCIFRSRRECDRAPSDISEMRQYQMATSLGAWINYFENQTARLHSGPIYHAHINYYLNESHGQMATNNFVWASILDNVEKSYSRQLKGSY